MRHANNTINKVNLNLKSKSYENYKNKDTFIYS
jgi:hypothetical protein